MSDPIVAQPASPQTPEALAREFLDALTGIEEYLRGKYGIESEEAPGLGDVVRIAKKSRNRIVREYYSALTAFKDLRNAIVHNRYQNGTPIATPLPETAQTAKHIFELFTKPPRMEHLNLTPPYSVEPTDSLQDCLKYMFEHEYAQAPVYRTTDSGREYCGLLTTNAVARWVARSMEDDGSLVLESASVAEVLDVAEDHEVALFWSKDRSIADAIDQLLRPGAPVALIITHSGDQNQKPLGMLVASDLHSMFKAIEVPSS